MWYERLIEVFDSNSSPGCVGVCESWQDGWILLELQYQFICFVTFYPTLYCVCPVKTQVLETKHIKLSPIHNIEWNTMTLRSLCFSPSHIFMNTCAFHLVIQIPYSAVCFFYMPKVTCLLSDKQMSCALRYVTGRNQIAWTLSANVSGSLM